jgi:hypothetical protein
MVIRDVFLLLFCFAAGGLPPLAARVTVTRLRCEYRVDPEGLGDFHSRLGWILQAEAWRAPWIGLDATPPTDGAAIDEAAPERLGRQPWVYADLEVLKTAPLTAYVRGMLALPTGRQLVRATVVLTDDQVCAITVNGRPAGAVTPHGAPHP